MATTSPRHLSASGCDATLNEVIIIGYKRGSGSSSTANGVKRQPLALLRSAATRMAKKGIGKKEEPSAHQSKGSVAAAVVPRRRALATKVRTPSSTVAVVITFITIFTFIVALEVLFIDETRNTSSSSATEESSDNNGLLHLAPPKRQISRFAGVGELLPQDAAGVAPSEITSIEPEANASTGDWQPVLGTREKFYVYSAYFDGRQGHTVRVIGATRTRGSQRVTCLLHYKGNSAPVLATIKVIRENWNLKYSAVFVLCPLYDQNSPTVLPVPEDVSVVAGEGYLIGNRIPVLHSNVSATSALPEGFGVCVKPLHYNFNRALQLIEFVELNRILGVGHFTFYNHTIGPDVECVLRAYIDERVVTLLPWDLDMLSQKEIRTEGLFAAINDCLYRHMHSFRYLLMIDMDEFIMPHRNDELPSMLHELSKKVDSNRAGSFSFMNSFFYLQWPNDSNSRGLEPLVTLLKTRRRAKFHPHKQRSKCIVVPRFVVEMGNHFVWEFLPGKGAVNVPPEVAFLHHYRVCEFGGNDCVKTASVTDRTVYKFKNELLLRVAERLRKTRRVCPEIKI